MDKVYQELLQIIREEGKSFNDEQLSIAVVRSVSPLEIVYKGMVFDRKEIKIADHLTERTIPVTLLTEDGVSPIVRDKENEELWHVDTIKKMKVPSPLEKENLVVVILREDVLWVLCKVV